MEYVPFHTGMDATSWDQTPFEAQFCPENRPKEANSAAFSENVATVASVANNSEVAAAIMRMGSYPPPSFRSKEGWATLLDDIRHVAGEYLSPALAMGWTLQDLFGCYRKPWCRRVDLNGLALFLHGQRIDAFEPNRAVIANRAGPACVFYRHSPASSQPFDRSGAWLVWDAYAPENLS